MRKARRDRLNKSSLCSTMCGVTEQEHMVTHGWQSMRNTDRHVQPPAPRTSEQPGVPVLLVFIVPGGFAVMPRHVHFCFLLLH